MAYKLFASGYLVNDDKVLLVHHNKFDKWVPCGGHMEEDETPAETAVREVFEETGLRVEVISAAPGAFTGDDNATPIALPFHMDLEREGFDVPHIGFFYYIRALEGLEGLKHQESEAHALGWFGLEDLDGLKTFDQVRALAKYAIENYPK